MSKISVFHTIWEKIEKIVLSQIRQNLKNNVSSIEEFNLIYQYAIKNFNYGNLIEKEWLRELKSEDPVKAHKFLERLSTFKFRHIRFHHLNKLIGYIVIILIGILTSATLYHYTNLGTFKVILWGIFSIIVASGILLPIFLARQNKHMEEVLLKYKIQLDNLQDSLINTIL